MYPPGTKLVRIVNVGNEIGIGMIVTVKEETRTGFFKAEEIGGNWKYTYFVPLDSILGKELGEQHDNL